MRATKPYLPMTRQRAKHSQREDKKKKKKGGRRREVFLPKKISMFSCCFFLLCPLFFPFLSFGWSFLRKTLCVLPNKCAPSLV